MTLDPDLLEQAYHLFAEEALELLQQIQETLLELPSDPSLVKAYSLVQAVSTIASGAAQVNLSDIYHLAYRFEKIFRWLWQEKTVVDAELEELLWDAYRCLRQSLLSTIQSNREETAAVLAQAELVFANLEACLAPKPNDAIDLAIDGDDLAEDAADGLPNQEEEVAQALENLETLLFNPEASNFLEALKAQANVFLSLGALLDIAEFTAVAQITLATLQVSPHSASTIGQLALAGFKGIWETSAQAVASPRESERETSVEALFERELAQDGEAFVAQADAIAVADVKKRTIETAKSLVWVTGDVATIVSSERVKEILLPRAEQLIMADGRQWLQWGESQLPIYRLSQLLVYHSSLPVRRRETDSVLVVFDRGGETIALDLAIDRLFVLPEVAIQPFSNAIAPPSYCYGCMTLDDGRLVVVIDLEKLLARTIDRIPDDHLAAPATTILVIDDSITARQVLALTLEKAGYRVLQAQDGEAGLRQMLHNRAIALAVSDIEMPNLNGFGFLKSCRQNPQLARVPVVLLSTHRSNRHRQMAIELGAAAYFSKPFDKKKFLAAIDAIVKRQVRKYL
jgi:chemotaxis protein histidine kinase CheA/ActR/RegA family two-component response regulator